MSVCKRIEARKLSGGCLIVLYQGQWIGNTFLGSIYEDSMRYLARKVREISSRLPQGVLMINNKIKVIKRRCYGILNVKHLFQRILLDLSG
jgi:hypothetical protein